MAVIEIKKDPSRKELAWLGALFALFFAAIGAMAYWRFGTPETAFRLWGIGAAVSVLYYAIPPIRKPLYLGWMYAAFPIGWTISHVLLGITYYLVLTPIGLVIRLLGRDPLERRFEPQRETYWSRHQPDADPARYFRQF